MKRMIAVMTAVIAISAAGVQEANAQDYRGGYQFGVGIRAAAVGGCCGMQREQPPYFAKFPPVYYSHIVRRPYGISPYAAPAGIAPVEMSVPMSKPVTKLNPYFNDQVAPAVEPVADQTTDATTEVGDKVARWQSNPFVVNGLVAK